MSCFDNEVGEPTYVKRLSKRMQESGRASSCSKNIRPVELQCRTPPSHKKNSETEVLCYSHSQLHSAPRGAVFSSISGHWF